MQWIHYFFRFQMTRLSRRSLNDVSSGELVNLLSNDVQRFDNVATALHSFWIAPFQIAVVTFYLWDKIGVVCLAGILSMVTLTLLQSKSPFVVFISQSPDLLLSLTITISPVLLPDLLLSPSDLPNSFLLNK